ncbi:MAG: hypothetical protein KIT58_01430 [Planctomycetota bacterium]|nr:hypothetical protein [Planctomycetota bacterium]
MRLGAAGAGNALTQPAPTGDDGLALALLASTVAEVKTVTVLVNRAPSVALPPGDDDRVRPQARSSRRRARSVAPAEGGALTTSSSPRRCERAPAANAGLRVELSAPGTAIDGVTSARGEPAAWCYVAADRPPGDVGATVFTRGGPVRLSATAP